MSALAKIEDMKVTGARKTREIKTTDPVYIKKLKDQVGAQKCAELIGVSAGAVSIYLNNYEATMPMELAAQFIYERDFPKPGSAKTVKPVTAIITGELHNLKTVQDMIVMLGGKFTFLPEM